jgi:hypothetical protein
MIDEEEKKLADKSAIEYFGKAIALVDVQKLGLYKDGFYAGLKEGRPQWHDLRKDKNDLPPLGKGCKHTSIKVVDEFGRVITYDYSSKYWRDYEDVLLGLQPYFWCEIPTFYKE